MISHEHLSHVIVKILKLMGKLQIAPVIKNHGVARGECPILQPQCPRYGRAPWHGRSGRGHDQAGAGGRLPRSRGVGTPVGERFSHRSHFLHSASGLDRQVHRDGSFGPEGRGCGHE